jgi:phenylalanine-4-hydroxylase
MSQHHSLCAPTVLCHNVHDTLHNIATNPHHHVTHQHNLEHIRSAQRESWNELCRRVWPVLKMGSGYV